MLIRANRILIIREHNLIRELEEVQARIRENIRLYKSKIPIKNYEKQKTIGEGT